MIEYRKTWSKVVITAVLAALAMGFTYGSATAQEEEHGSLEFEFIGNSSFRITDGKVTMVSDYPYRSGADGVMKYKYKDVVLKGDVILLVTHGHFDHFDGVLFRQMACGLIAPESVTEPFPGYRVYPTEETMEYEGITIEAERTPHGRSEHYSYLVTWHGLRIYFAGDAERADALLSAKNLDVAFVPPALLKSLHETGAVIDAKKIVVYHHKSHEVVGEHQNRVLPKQGDTFTIDY